jgi:hypothetical protein
VGISDAHRAQITNLIAEGENLNVLDLEAFYRWVDDAYEALGFDPLQKERFDEYCRSSSDLFSARVLVGVWMLRLALEDASAHGKEQRKPLP